MNHMNKLSGYTLAILAVIALSAQAATSDLQPREHMAFVVAGHVANEGAILPLHTC